MSCLPCLICPVVVFTIFRVLAGFILLCQAGYKAQVVRQGMLYPVVPRGWQLVRFVYAVIYNSVLLYDTGRVERLITLVIKQVYENII